MEGTERKKIAFAYHGLGSVSWDVPFHPLYYLGEEKMEPWSSAEPNSVPTVTLWGAVW